MFLVFGLFFVCSLGIFGYLIFKTYMEKQAFKALSPTEQVDFTRWANTPLAMPVPPLRERTSTGTMEARQQFKEAALAVADRVPEIKKAGPPAMKRILSDTGLSLIEQEAVTSFTVLLEPVVNQALRLVARSDYTFSPRNYPGPHERLSGWTSVSTYFCVYITGALRNNDWDAALEAIQAAFGITRSDAGSPMVITALHGVMLPRVLGTVTRVSELTSDTVVLRRLLQVLSSSQASFTVDPVEYASLYYRQMQVDGYLGSALPTPIQDEEAVYWNDGYLKWVVDTLPPYSQRHQWAQETLATRVRYYGSGPAAGILARVDVGLAKPFVRPFIRMNSLPDFVTMWKFRNQYKLEEPATAAKYHLLRLHIASRIAQIEGRPAPPAPADVVPAYLPSVPADPYTSAPMSYSTSRRAHYSAGPDATSGTLDDIYLTPVP